MGVRKISKTSLVAALGLIGIAIHLKCFALRNPKSAHHHLNGVVDRTKSYSTPGSIAAIINTPKMGTGGLQKTFYNSWRCPDADPVPKIAVNQCADGRRFIRTHFVDTGFSDVRAHREKYPNGQCLITTAVRSPASWFGSLYLQKAKQQWMPADVMVRNYRTFLATSTFKEGSQVLPELLNEFGAGTLIEQAKIMDDNGGYSFIPAPEESELAGCDLLFLRLEEGDRWPDIFERLDPEIKNIRGESRLQDYPDHEEQINAIVTYELTSEEKIHIYNNQDEFIRNWFDAYRYMDGVTDTGVKGVNS